MKLIYALWGAQNVENIEGATAMSQATEAVAPAAPLRMGDGLPDALVSFAERAPDLSSFCDHFHGWQVEEHVPLPADPARPGINKCFNQVTLLNFKPGLARKHALKHWREVHTALAIETQDTFYYGQNLVLKAVTARAPTIDAIVEEWFPIEAMTSPNAFFDAAGDDEKLERNRKKMIGSCAQFLDFKTLEVIPMEIIR